MEEMEKRYLSQDRWHHCIFDNKTRISRIEIIINPYVDLPGIDVSSTQDGSILVNFDSNDDYIDEIASLTLRIISSSRFGNIYLKGDWSNGFSNFIRLLSIKGLKNLDTTEVTDMFAMFFNCKNLESIDLSSWNTSNVIDMSHMFESCEKLKSLDLSMLNKSNVEDATNMFYRCLSLEELDLGDFNPSKVSDIFYECPNLEDIQVDLTPIYKEILRNNKDIVFNPFGDGHVAENYRMKRERIR